MAASSGGLCPEGEEHRVGVGQGSPVSLGLRLLGQWPGPGRGLTPPAPVAGSLRSAGGYDHCRGCFYFTSSHFLFFKAAARPQPG